jgi:antirestriction protein ArdC
MARSYNRAPTAERTQAEPEIRWASLLNDLLTMPPGSLENYQRFHSYSMGNLALLMAQGVSPQPVAPFSKWNELGRRVKKGSKAKAIMIPTMRKVENEKTGEEERRLTGFIVRNRVFPVCDTEGDVLPELEPTEWDKERALGALAIKQVKFELFDGDTAGYSIGREFAVSEVAPYPLKTMFHELQHIQQGHTTPEQLPEYQTHRGIKEFQAEAGAVIVLNELGLQERMNVAESRGYVQHYMRSEKPSDAAIRQVFKASDEILKAGRPQGDCNEQG